mmetsp:Transcript_22511/g.62171  ORF Transcript_22511/g.62171 Transcript_22511/m.62171 type:complete len:205 (+) Transcript_22511:1229-1843(+)
MAHKSPSRVSPNTNQYRPPVHAHCVSCICCLAEAQGAQPFPTLTPSPLPEGSVLSRSLFMTLMAMPMVVVPAILLHIMLKYANITVPVLLPVKGKVVEQGEPQDCTHGLAAPVIPVLLGLGQSKARVGHKLRGLEFSWGRLSIIAAVPGPTSASSTHPPCLLAHPCQNLLHGLLGPAHGLLHAPHILASFQSCKRCMPKRPSHF